MNASNDFFAGRRIQFALKSLGEFDGKPINRSGAVGQGVIKVEEDSTKILHGIISCAPILPGQFLRLSTQTCMVRHFRAYHRHA